MTTPSQPGGAPIPPPPEMAAPKGSIVVYTAITGEYDTLKEQPDAARDGTDFIAFLDAPHTSQTWRIRPIHTGFADPSRNAKIHKILPHVYFPDARYSLWIDGSVTIRFPFSLRRLIELYLADCDLAVFQHKERTCIYQEASVCLHRQLDDPDVIWRQICRYTQEGHPPNAGLGECPVVLRRHTPEVQAFNDAWWEEIAHGSKRDQLSFQYVARTLGRRYGTFPGTVRETSLFHRGRHTSARAPYTDRRHVVPASRRSPRRTVAFGPVRNSPSWDWVGFDTARELSKYYNVVPYDGWSSPPDCDVTFVVKKRPPDDFVIDAQRKGTKLIYCPVDVYRDHEHLERDADFMRSCTMVMLHCERLLPLVRPYCPNVHFVEHHARYVLNAMPEYRETGFILWIGACQYLPYLLRWLVRHPIAHDIRILTNLDNERSRQLAAARAAESGIELCLSEDTTSIAGYPVYQWTQRRQDEMMRTCKAALDVKMTETFEQYHKPPTKAQQFVASGIPFAVNPESYSAEYFRVRGYDVASPIDTARWLSPEYWEAMRAYGERLRIATSLESVGARYRDLIESLWGCGAPR